MSAAVRVLCWHSELPVVRHHETVEAERDVLQTFTQTHPKDFTINVTIGVIKGTNRSRSTTSGNYSDKG